MCSFRLKVKESNLFTQKFQTLRLGSVDEKSTSPLDSRGSTHRAFHYFQREELETRGTSNNNSNKHRTQLHENTPQRQPHMNDNRRGTKHVFSKITNIFGEIAPSTALVSPLVHDGADFGLLQWDKKVRLLMGRHRDTAPGTQILRGQEGTFSLSSS